MSNANEVWRFYLKIEQHQFQDRRLFHLDLFDDAGHSGSSLWPLDLQKVLEKNLTWSQFLDYYRQCAAGERLQTLFGKALFKELFMYLPDLNRAWREIMAAASGKPFCLTLIFGKGSEEVARLPLELVHDDRGFVFNRPEAALCRSYATLPSADFTWPRNPKMLFIWAFPAGDIQPQPIETVLDQVFPDMDKIPNCSMKSLNQHLQETDTEYDGVFLLAHGRRDSGFGMVQLHSENGGEEVDASHLAAALQGRVKQLAFLCSCRSADGEDDAFSGMAQKFLTEVPGVVATQGNLPVQGSADLALSFFEHLRDSPSAPDKALARARIWAYKTMEQRDAWSVPILLVRPPALSKRETVPDFVAGLPPQKDTFMPRDDLLKKGLALLRKHRLVSVEGLPGIGKTEIGRELAREAKRAGLCRLLLYQEVRSGVTVELLRNTLTVALGVSQMPEADGALAALLHGKNCLLVLDNAEDLMPDPQSQSRFAEFLDALLAAGDLRILLTTRWRVGETENHEAPLDIPPMDKKQTKWLFKRELEFMEQWRPEWEGDPVLDRLLTMIDGHPRSLWLISRHFESSRVSLLDVTQRLETLKAEAVMAPGLLGRADIYETLKEDKKARLKSLAASMDFSFEILERRHPRAANAYLGLSLFPGGVPETVARKMVGGSGLELEQLVRYHLVEWREERVFYPVPLHWYAEGVRTQRGFEEGPWLDRALDGFADFAEYCDQVAKTDILKGAALLLKEEPAFNLLMEVGEDGGETSRLARMAYSSANLMLLLQRLTTLEDWLKIGLAAAQARGDKRGEANCLKSKGDLCIRGSALEEAGAACEGALEIFREIGNRLGEANCLLSKGYLCMRGDALEEAGAAYEGALEIYREKGARLGEANCLQSKGDLFRRGNALEEAGAAYEGALEIYRAIGARLGEANCLKSKGLLALANNKSNDAFKDFAGVLEIYKQLKDRLGVQAALGCMARSAGFMDQPDLALVLAEQSLQMGREISDAFGQSITLQLQIDLFLVTKNWPALVGATHVFLEVARGKRDDALVQWDSGLLDQLKEKFSAEDWDAMKTHAEEFRFQAIVEAAERVRLAEEP